MRCTPLRRFGAQFEVPMPDGKARRAILQLVLQQHAKETEDYSDVATSVDPALLQVCIAVAYHPGSALALLGT